MATHRSQALTARRGTRRTPRPYPAPMIRTSMNRADWAILLHPRPHLGRAPSSSSASPCAKCRRSPMSAAAVSFAALALVGCTSGGAAASSACRASAWRSMLLLALLNNAHPVHPVRLGPDPHRQRPRLDPQRDHADLGRGRRPSVHRRRADDPAQARRRPARLRRRRADDRARPARARSAPTAWPQLACVAAAFSYALAGVWARRFKRAGHFAARGQHRPADRRRG